MYVEEIYPPHYLISRRCTWNNNVKVRTALQLTRFARIKFQAGYKLNHFLLEMIILVAKMITCP